MSFRQLKRLNWKYKIQFVSFLIILSFSFIIDCSDSSSNDTEHNDDDISQDDSSNEPKEKCKDDFEVGDIDTEECGLCGQRLRTCMTTGYFSEWTECMGEGECDPQKTNEETRKNEYGGIDYRNCSDNCHWTEWNCDPTCDEDYCGPDKCGSQCPTCIQQHNNPQYFCDESTQTCKCAPNCPPNQCAFNGCDGDEKERCECPTPYRICNENTNHCDGIIEHCQPTTNTLDCDPKTESMNSPAGLICLLKCNVLSDCIENDECIDGFCMPTKTNYECIDDKTISFDWVCGNIGAIKTDDREECPGECCNNKCCESNHFCCNGKCCPNDTHCCGSECCPSNHVCCNDVCCEGGSICCAGECTLPCDPDVAEFPAKYACGTKSFDSGTAYGCISNCPYTVGIAKSSIGTFYTANGSDIPDTSECVPEINLNNTDCCLDRDCNRGSEDCCGLVDRACDIACKEMGHRGGYEITDVDYIARRDNDPCLSSFDGTCKCVDGEPPCVPDCRNRECGPDEYCHESCGNCPDGFYCEMGICYEDEPDVGYLIIYDHRFNVTTTNVCNDGSNKALTLYTVMNTGIDCDPFFDYGCVFAGAFATFPYVVWGLAPGEHKIYGYCCLADYPNCVSTSADFACPLPDPPGGQTTCKCGNLFTNPYPLKVNIQKGKITEVIGCY